MLKSESIKELALALSKAQGQFEHAKKDVKNDFFKSKYATLASVIDAAKIPLLNNGLSVSQTTSINESGGVVLTTLLMHSSGEWIQGDYPIMPVKPDPQAYGSALTYGRRYMFAAITGIAPDDDDDDGNAASGRNFNGQKSKPPEKPKDYSSPLLPLVEKIRELSSEEPTDYESIKNMWNTIDRNKQQVVWKMLNQKEKSAVSFAVQGKQEGVEHA